MTASDVIFPPGATQRDWVADVALAVSLTVVSIVPYVGLAAYHPRYQVWIVLSAAMTLPLVLRRHAPLAMLALCTLAGIGQLIAIPDQPTPSLLAVPIASYSVARWVPGNAARSVIVIGVFASVLGPLTWFPPFSGTASSDILFWGACLGAVLTPYAVGRRLHELADARARQDQAAEERYQHLLAERDHQAKFVEASTRAMIARELHDIVAHSLSVMIVQAEGGRAAAPKRPDIAVEALDTIAETGREALQEMRRIVGVLRGGPGAGERPDFAPMPTLRDIPELVARTSDRAALLVQGEPFGVGQALALTLYRVTQEALTNFLKHAGPDAHALVTLTYESGRITVDVVDDGTGVDDPGDGGGNGLRGMYERVTSMGGALRAGPREDGPGFRVTASLPVRDAVPPSPPRRS